MWFYNFFPEFFRNFCALWAHLFIFLFRKHGDLRSSIALQKRKAMIFSRFTVHVYSHSVTHRSHGGVAAAEGKTRPQTQRADSVHLRRHFSSKNLPCTIKCLKARVNHKKMIIDPWYKPYGRPSRHECRSWTRWIQVGRSGGLSGHARWT